MSQAGIITDGGSAAADVEFLTGDVGGAVGVDAGNNIFLLTGAGLTSTGNPATNTITFTMDNAPSGSAQTIGAVTADVITISLGATPSTFSIEARVAAFESGTPAGAGYKLFGAFITDGAAATLIGTVDQIVNEDAALAAADATFVTSGNDVILRVTGVALLTIEWDANAEYTIGV